MNKCDLTDHTIDQLDYRGRCIGTCTECDEHLAQTGRYTTYCLSCDTCPECSCPNADGFAHYEGCTEANELAEN